MWKCKNEIDGNDKNNVINNVNNGNNNNDMILWKLFECLFTYMHYFYNTCMQLWMMDIFQHLTHFFDFEVTVSIEYNFREIFFKKLMLCLSKSSKSVLSKSIYFAAGRIACFRGEWSKCVIKLFDFFIKSFKR